MEIENEDLPRGWVVFPGDPEDAERIENALVRSDPDDDIHVQHSHAWERVRNTITGESVWLRISRDVGGDAFKISGLVALPGTPGSRIINQSIRSISLSGIEQALEERRHSNKQYGWLHAHNASEGWDPLEPLGKPREIKGFYARVALQFLTLKESGEERPVARMVEINQRPAKTVQGWVAESRRKGFLPPGRQGKAG